MTVRFSTWVEGLVPTTTLLSANDKIAVVTDAPDTRSITRNNLAKSLIASVLTTDGDLVTRTGGEAARITRASLADDQAFVNRYIPRSLATTKGDVIAGLGGGSVARLPVGTNSHVLTADSSSSTGLMWAPASDASKLPLTGGDLTGALTGTSASFTSFVAADNYSLGITSLPTIGTSTLDFSSTGYLTQGALTGNVTYAGSNYQEGVTVTVRVVTGGAQRTVSFPSGWVFLGVRPVSIAANKTAILTVTSFGSTEQSCVAAWAVQA